MGIMWVVGISASAPRDPADWIEDMRWHRHMFRQSYFRWVPEHPTTIALRWTKGRVVFETPAHLRVLEDQLIELRTYAAGIEHAMVPRLAEAQARSTSRDWEEGLGLLGMSQKDVELLRFNAPSRFSLHRDARRALHGWPFPNPYSQVWELMQMRSMYTAAEDLLEDAFTDLVVELVPRHGWRNLSQILQSNRSERALQSFVEWHRRRRGEPGDRRRELVQTYPPQ